MFKKLLPILFTILLFTACGGDTAPTVTSSDIVDALQAAGLEAESPSPMSADDYGLAPYLGEGTHFLVPSLCEDCGGRAFVTDNNSDAQKIADTYIAIGEESALFFSWVFIKDNMVIQINGDLDEDTARQYEAALNDM